MAIHDAEYCFTNLIAAEDWHFWFRARRRLVLWALRRHLPHTRSLLEVGCGAGFVLAGLREQNSELCLAACDASREALAHARSRVSGVHLFQADARQLPIARQFDAIAALDVIEHIDEDDAALSEMFRALRPGGGLILTVPQHQWLWSRVDDYSCHRRRYDRRGLLAKIRSAGFEPLQVTSYFSATLPFALLSRLTARGGDSFDPTAELRIPRIVNAGLAALLMPEDVLVRMNVSLPIGGTLMVVARRPNS
jgi:SAM-dependent methyltransferase